MESQRWRNGYIVFISIVGGLLLIVKIAGFIVGRKAPKGGSPSKTARNAAVPARQNGSQAKTTMPN